MRLETRSVAAAATALLLGASVAGCGAKHAADPGAAAPAGSTTSHTTDNGLQPPTTTSGSRDHGSGTRPPGAPAKGAYDDTSGTKARQPKNQKAVLAHLPGSASVKGCVAVGSRTDVRAGSIAMGNFADARARFRSAPDAYRAAPSFFYVITSSRASTRVTVTASRLGGSGTSVRASAAHPQQAAQWKYYPIHLTLPQAGTWRFRVTAAGSTSCFDAGFAT